MVLPIRYIPSLILHQREANFVPSSYHEASRTHDIASTGKERDTHEPSVANLQQHSCERNPCERPKCNQCVTRCIVTAIFASPTKLTDTDGSQTDVAARCETKHSRIDDDEWLDCGRARTNYGRRQPE